MRGSGAVWPFPVPNRDGAKVRAMAARILSERQFHQGTSLLQRILDWLGRQLNFRTPTALSGSWLSDLVLAGLVGAVIALVIVAARRGAFGRLRHPRSSPGVVVSEEGSAMSPDGWRREADRLAAEGRYREALRCRYRALVGELARRGVVDEVPGRTSGDYERLVGERLPGVAPQFSTATRLFERCWYGHEPSDARAQSTFEELAAAIVQAVRARSMAFPGPAFRTGERPLTSRAAHGRGLFVVAVLVVCAAALWWVEAKPAPLPPYSALVNRAQRCQGPRCPPGAARRPGDAPPGLYRYRAKRSPCCCTTSSMTPRGLK